MKSKNIRTVFLSLILLLSSILSAGCGMYKIESLWRDRELISEGVDGVSEWENAQYIFQKENVSIGIINDDNALYLRLSTHDRNLQKQLLSLGFTVWFNPKGGKKKEIGIHYPVGMQGGGMQMMQRGGSTDRGKLDEQLQKMLDTLPGEIEIRGTDKNDSFTLTTDEAKDYGIEVHIGYSRGNLMYELKMPLIKDISHPYSIGTETQQVVGIGLESEKIDMSQMSNRKGGHSSGMGGRGGGGMGGKGGGGGGRGGMGGGKGGRSGGMGGKSEGMRPQMQEAIELWLKTLIARESSES